ncbi:hypothetical protein ACH5RR_011567 [Cinchona calisaya]|uniref:BZIP domain-containing protein n=1 Tax=Cinchona calisaya TaxID=153742 RepID=A0ABD3A596_9GENT
MLSTFPAMMNSDGLFGDPLPAFEGGFTPWDCQEPPFVFPQYYDEPILSPVEFQEPVISNSGSDNPTPLDSISTSGSDDLNQNNSSNKRCNSGSDETTNPPVVDERKRRRMLSNRESARRSRMRKQKHLENLRNQVNRLRNGKRELMNRLSVVTHHCQVVRSDNDRLRSESVMLRQRLWDIRQVLLVRQLQQQLATSAASAWPCNNNFTSINYEDTIPQSLIT